MLGNQVEMRRRGNRKQTAMTLLNRHHLPQEVAERKGCNSQQSKMQNEWPASWTEESRSPDHTIRTIESPPFLRRVC